MSEWKLMDSAPKDGALVVLYFGNTFDQPWQAERGCVVAFWSDPSVGDTLPEDAGWYAHESDGNMLRGEPKLWYFLPEPE